MICKTLARARALLSVLCLVAISTTAVGQVSIATERYDNSRLGANLQETQLTQGNVNAGNFGKLWAYPVDGRSTRSLCMFRI